MGLLGRTRTAAGRARVARQAGTRGRRCGLVAAALGATCRDYPMADLSRCFRDIRDRDGNRSRKSEFGQSAAVRDRGDEVTLRLPARHQRRATAQTDECLRRP